MIVEATVYTTDACCELKLASKLARLTRRYWLLMEVGDSVFGFYIHN